MYNGAYNHFKVSLEKFAVFEKISSGSTPTTRSSFEKYKETIHLDQCQNEQQQQI